jgi:hypothetical protein
VAAGRAAEEPNNAASCDNWRTGDSGLVFFSITDSFLIFKLLKNKTFFFYNCNK